jgi:hypothetical protein
MAKKKNGAANGKKNGTPDQPHEELLDSPWEKGMLRADDEGPGPRNGKRGKKQPELPTLERESNEELDALMADRYSCEVQVNRAERELEKLEGRVQLALDHLQLDFYDFVDGEVTRRVYRERKERLKFVTVTTAPKAKKEKRLGADQKKRKRAAPAGAGASA